MAITTTNEKLALMDEEVWEPALPIDPSTLGQDDQQQLLWGFPGILWGAKALIEFALDMNTRIYRFLCDHFSVESGDLTTMTKIYLDTQLTGDYTARFRQLEQNATDATQA